MTKWCRLLAFLLFAFPCYGQALWNGLEPSTQQQPLTIRVSDGDNSSILGTARYQATSFTLTKNATNYIYLDLTQQPPKVVINTTGFPATALYKIAIAVTGNDRITSLTDSRPPFNTTFGSGSSSITLQTNGVNNTTQNVLNLKNGSNTTLTPDAFGGVVFSAIAATYQNGVAQTPEPAINFAPPFALTDNPGNYTTVTMPGCVGVGASHAMGLVPDPGASPHSPHYYLDETCSWSAPTATAAVANPLNSGDLSNSTFPWQINGDMIFKGPNPGVYVTAYGARAVTPSVAPATTGITGTISGGANILTISSASTFQNGDGIDVVGAGAANGLGTPAAPTVTPAAPNGPTGTGLVVNYTWGSTAYSYKVIWRTIGQGLTAASTAGTTSTGPATLGPQSNTLVGCTRVTQQVSCQTTAPHQLNVGESVFISGTSDNVNFGGDQKVDGVADSTHFTFTNGLTVTNGATTSATGGTIRYYNCNHLVLTPPTGSPWQAYIYGRTSGTWNLVGVSQIVNSSYSDDPTYMTWDDYGSTMGAAPTVPYFVPSAAPSSATNDTLVTTIVSGAGTTTLTLAANATNGVSGATVLFDDAPTILAAITAARSFVTGGGKVILPAITQDNTFPAYVTELGAQHPLLRQCHRTSASGNFDSR